MAIANLSGARVRAERPGRIAPTYSQSPADRVAHAQATHLSPKGREALGRLYPNVIRLRDESAWAARDDEIRAEVDAAYAERDNEYRAEIRMGLAA